MKISGFTMCKNASKLYYPVKASIESILPIVDEFIIALGDCDENDNTLELINKINSDKIKIINTKWDTDIYQKNTILAQQTDIAKEHCSGDWLFYIQCDEVIHEKDLDIIKTACLKHKDNKNVDGFLFNYLHFWGDYQHYHNSHTWYKKEIRMIRNLAEIHSWKDAQSFRKFQNWNGGSYEDYMNFKEGKKLNVIPLDIPVFHYGYVRPPELMSTKSISFTNSYHGKNAAKLVASIEEVYDYGPLNKLCQFNGSHPKIMEDWIKKFNWKSQLQYSGRKKKKRVPHKHEKIKYKLLSFIENTFLKGKVIGGFKNYNQIE